MEKREQVFKVLKEIYKESKNFSLNCLEVCDGRCEAGDLLLAPHEHEFLKTTLKTTEELFPVKSLNGDICGFLPEEGDDCKSLCKDKKTCTLRPYRPIDCMTFPIFPKFNNGKMSFYVSTVCPLWDKLSPGYREAAKRAWEKIHPFLSHEWKEHYDSNFEAYKAVEIFI